MEAEEILGLQAELAAETQNSDPDFKTLREPMPLLPITQDNFMAELVDVVFFFFIHKHFMNTHGEQP